MTTTPAAPYQLAAAAPASIEGCSFAEMEAAIADCGETVDYEDQVADNGARAGFAALGVVEFAKEVGLYGNEGLTIAIGDLLGDLHHLTDLLGIDWATVIALGEGNYEDEIHSRS